VNSIETDDMEQNGYFLYNVKYKKKLYIALILLDLYSCLRP